MPLCLHELAHGLEEFPLLAEIPEALVPAECRAVLSYRMAGSAEGYIFNAPAAERLLRPKWYQHGARFIRCALHVLHRAAKLGLSVTPEQASIAGPWYGLSAGWLYAMALGDEPRDLEQAPLAWILDSDPPETFTRLWELDTAGTAAAA